MPHASRGVCRQCAPQVTSWLFGFTFAHVYSVFAKCVNPRRVRWTIGRLGLEACPTVLVSTIGWEIRVDPFCKPRQWQTRRWVVTNFVESPGVNAVELLWACLGDNARKNKNSLHKFFPCLGNDAYWCNMLQRWSKQFISQGRAFSSSRCACFRWTYKRWAA